MKKIVLSIAAVMAATTFAPEASAVPVFARQTGMACTACHFQHFPLLNGFGRAFKSAGFTMMGAQEKVEGEHLSLPSVLNLAVLTTTGYETASNSAQNFVGGNGGWFVPGNGGEMSLFIGGRISEFAGFLTEMGMGSAASTGAAKIALMFPVGESHVGVVAHTSGGQGVAYSYETLNTGAVNTHKMTALNGAGQSHTSVYSAAQYLGTNTAATGLSLVASNDNMGFINIGKYDLAGVGGVVKNPATGAANVGGTTAGSLPLTYVRVAGLFEAAGFEMGAGIQSFSGTSQVNAATAAGVAIGLPVGSSITAKATVIDFQAQGEVSGMGLGVYTSYGTAAANTATSINVLNFSKSMSTFGTLKKSSFNIGAELGVIPGIATMQLAFRSGKSGQADVAGGNLSDNAFQIGGTYELAQNLELSLTHSSNSGGVWGVDPVTGLVPAGKTVTSLLMEALF